MLIFKVEITTLLKNYLSLLIYNKIYKKTMKMMVISVIILILFVPFSSAFGSWHWSSPYEVCGTEVIKKGEICELNSEIKQDLVVVEKSCKDGFLEIIKKTTNSSQCVKESSFEKLIKRGWGINP